MATRVAITARLVAGCALLVACKNGASAVDDSRAATDSKATTAAASATATTATKADASTTTVNGARQQWDFGDPSPEAQYALYLINRARADPAAEGQRLASTANPTSVRAIEAFKVDTATVVSDFGGYAASPPLAFNAQLAEAAAAHATDQAAHRTQSHLGSDGTKPRDRILATGLAARAIGENLASYVASALEAHESFQIDWGGPPPSGVQDWPDPKHRRNIMATNATSARFDSIGIAFVTVASIPAAANAMKPAEGDPPYGPLVAVQEFASTGERFAVGTVYTDTNSNGAFDPGEGIAGVTVIPKNSAFQARTASDGAYAVPIEPGLAAVDIEFSGNGWADEQSVTAQSDESVLKDLTR